MAKAILYDASKCTACRACQVACKSWNELPAETTSNRGSYENPADLSPTTWLKMEFREIEDGAKIRWLFNRRACMHCTDAACVRVCPTGSLYHHKLGFVAYDKDTCSGCGYCADACPFNVPRSDRNILTGTAKMDKCTFCTTPGLDRVSAGEEPSCVKACPSGALSFRDRSEMVAEGKKRVQALKAKGMANANLYGETELNGLHVLYVLEESPSTYGLPEKPQVSAATIAWKNVIQPIGWAVGGLTIVGLGLNYIVARANAKKEAK
ncbi:Formate dehydrogenase, nitrate-inducible, iron-sulfur subunit [subsurface metagenome]